MTIAGISQESRIAIATAGGGAAEAVSGVALLALDAAAQNRPLA